MEAMACGKPVIATPVGDVPLLVRNKVNGLLTPSNDTRALVDRIANLAERPETREKMGKRNVIEMRQYDWDEIAKKYLQIFRRVLTGRDDLVSLSLHNGRKAAEVTRGSDALEK